LDLTELSDANDLKTNIFMVAHVCDNCIIVALLTLYVF